ncbi:MAG TPA: Rrf2 family transcriptional regulator [Deferrisomatales bacterium]|nr:Rrf2 family transcriptional regulator [Deferrisomatales bacterium]
MIITRATEYSIRAVLHLASRYPAEVVSKQEICAAEGVTPAFLTKILQPLIRSGLVRSKRGVAGGFALARNPDKLTLLDVMQAVDEPLTLNLCLLEGHQCERECTCPIHSLWTTAREKIEEVFSGKTLSALVAERAQREQLVGSSAAH